MKILIAGAGGQLGRALQTVLAGHEIIALTHARLDVTRVKDTREAVAAHRPDVVINAAAYTDVGAMRRDGFARVFNPRNVSTDYVFDGQGDRPYHEFDRTNPLSIYGKSKLAGEQAAAAHNPRHYIVRTSWLYHNEGKNFPKAMLAQSQRAEVRVACDQYGSPTYAPHLAHEKDNVSAIFRCRNLIMTLKNITRRTQGIQNRSS